MITKLKAISIAEQYLREEEKKTNYNLVLLLNNIIEFDYGWVFFYQSKEFVETGDILEMLGGNAPIIINNLNGGISETGTSKPIEEYIEEYRAALKKSNHNFP